jgi:hypothetical protein
MTCPVCRKRAQEKYKEWLSQHGTFVDRFFLAPGKQSAAPELCSPRDIAALFFDFLKKEGVIKVPKRKGKTK